MSEAASPSSAPAFSFGISEFTTWPWTFEHDVESYARLGVNSIEICEFKVDRARLFEQLGLISARNLEISGIQPSVRTLFPSSGQPEPKRIPDRMSRYRKTIDSFSALRSGLTFVTNTGIAPDGNIQEVLDTAQREYRDLADYAAEHGARVALEPLNAAIMNIESAVWTVEQAMDIVHAVDRPNFGICLDLWNVWQNADVDEAIASAGDRIFTVEVSDWRTPRSYLDRLIPGDGEIPLPRLLRAAHESGYRGAYVVEIFSGDVPDSLWQENLDEVITRSQDGLTRAWQEAFASDIVAGEFAMREAARQ